jgi:hypothetical protein
MGSPRIQACYSSLTTARSASMRQLMRDEWPREGRDRYGGFESGLRQADGRKKVAYAGFRLPIVARRAAAPTAWRGAPTPARATRAHAHA